MFVFHEVSDQPSRFAQQYDIAVSKTLFRRQATWIRSNFNVIHPSGILRGVKFPERAAIISFDDGFLGSFENGFVILEELELPSIIFLNMQAILEQIPILSATASFLDRYVPEFSDFSKTVGLPRPFHLTLTPSILSAFESDYGTVDKAAIIAYQGRFADWNVVRRWDGRESVAFGNHLFNHWNAAALSSEELEEQYSRNEHALSMLQNKVNLFAFTNGQPETCFSSRDVDLLQRLGAGKVFSASGRINRCPQDKYLLERMSLNGSDTDENHLWFRTGRAVLRDLCAPSTKEAGLAGLHR